METSPSSSDHRLARIDVLRGVAILLVLVFHSYGAACGRDRVEDWLAVFSRTSPHPPWSFLLLYPLHFGNAGVPLFFVISGYVIHRSYLRDPHFSWAAYASRRFWRIYPAYFVALLGFAVWIHVVRSRNFALHAGFVYNFSNTTFFGINPSFWSLAVEVQLYCLYPLALLVRKAWTSSGMLLASLVVSAAWRLIAFECGGWPHASTYHIWISPIVLWPDWLLGAYLAERHASQQRLFRRPALWVAAGAVLLVGAEFSKPLLAIQFSLMSIIAAVALDVYVSREGTLSRLARLLAFVGVCSYSLYLIHQPLMWNYASFLIGHGLSHPLLKLVFGFPVYALVALACAWVMYVTVERGGIRLGKYLSRSARSEADRHHDSLSMGPPLAPGGSP